MLPCLRGLAAAAAAPFFLRRLLLLPAAHRRARVSRGGRGAGQRRQLAAQLARHLPMA